MRGVVGAQVVGKCRTQPRDQDHDGHGQQRRADRIAAARPSVRIFDGIEFLPLDDGEIGAEVTAVPAREAHGSLNGPARVGYGRDRTGDEYREEQGKQPDRPGRGRST